MKSAQDLQRLGHCLGIKITVSKYSFAQPSNFAVLMQGDQPSAPKFGDTEPH
jgi:hypothetical protein